ncbi:MAG: putative toxin-antitoxin system toxin component, PIN family [Campylobacterota bacterium]
MKYNILLDTNVLVTALRSKHGASFLLLKLIDDKRIQLHVSTPLIKEYEDVLSRAKHKLNSDDVKDILDYLTSIAIAHKIYYLWRPILRDIKDDMVLELAVKANSMIITYNTDDFKEARSFNIAVLNPKEFLNMLGEL